MRPDNACSLDFLLHASMLAVVLWQFKPLILEKNDNCHAMTETDQAGEGERCSIRGAQEALHRVYRQFVTSREACFADRFKLICPHTPEPLPNCRQK